MGGLGRRTAYRAGLVVLGLAVMGMGAMGGGRDTGMPARDFGAALTDVDGTRIEVTRLAVGGDTNLEGDVGRGRLRVPFDNITRVDFEPVGENRDRIHAKVTLREGAPVTLTVRPSTTFYGQTPSGAYQIRARDLRSIEFLQ